MTAHFVVYVVQFAQSQKLPQLNWPSLDCFLASQLRRAAAPGEKTGKRFHTAVQRSLKIGFDVSLSARRSVLGNIWREVDVCY